VQLPEGLARGPEAARSLADKAMLQRSQDFAGSTQTYLLACRVQWDAVNTNVPGAALEDLRWYIASYISTKAGALSQVQHNFRAARPYYLAFFWMVQEDDPLWDRMRRLINPMLSYYWANAIRELNLTFAPATSPARTAVQAAVHPNAEVRRLWLEVTEALARVNPRLLHRIAAQIRLEQADSTEARQVADQIESMLSENGAGTSSAVHA